MRLEEKQRPETLNTDHRSLSQYMFRRKKKPHWINPKIAIYEMLHLTVQRGR